MQSVQIGVYDNRDRLPLSDFNAIYGRLHVKGIISLKKHGQLVDSLQMETESAGILDLELSDHRLHVFGIWHD